MILTADWHLDDNVKNSYRWDIFPSLHNIMQQTGDRNLFVLGDLTEKKDKHSGELVNCIVAELKKFEHVALIKGNHDQPVMGEAYWKWLDNIPNITYYTEPKQVNDLLLLPHSVNPTEDWKHVDYATVKAIFMHQNVLGAFENGRPVRGGMKLKFPANIKVYSGDIHTPQVVEQVTYVGAPHPVDFGDDYKCRVLLLDSGYNIRREIGLDAPKKAIREITSLQELQNASLRPGDQVLVRYVIPLARMNDWQREQNSIRKWAYSNQVIIDAIELVPETDAKLELANAGEKPEDMYRVFAANEGYDGDVFDYGLKLIERFPK